MPPVGRRGNLQCLADWLDPKAAVMLVDEGLHDLKRRSSSAWAKNALASFRISLALRSSRTSRSKAWMRCCSVVVGPARWPASRLRWRIHLRSVSAEQPILAAMDSGRRPLRVVLVLGLEHHAHRAFDDLGGELRGLPHHGSIFSREGASAKAGAVHLGAATLMAAMRT